MIIKICSKCKKQKSILHFDKNNQGKLGVRPDCKECVSIYNKKRYIKKRKALLKKQKIYQKKFPEKIILNSIKQRCNNPNHKSYKDYGGRGIACKITENEIKNLMIRDNYWKIKDPTIDRKNNDGHYELSNCRFIERIKNIKRQNRNKFHKIILQYDLNDKFIKEWDNITKASNTLSIDAGNIIKCAKKKLYYSHAGGYKWKYKVS